ncbi:nucleotidyltransferase and HEPN domain-containing protein [Rhizobium sp. Root482]|uniref:nucleotidyltransferase and HEPN domain-containing protein n=1 Tax=Rhizobium sp. Root482 TaxID=1736543 RepID=UPI0006F8B5FD|nr:nucleotidyltransferase and HEPN domain-containing protein [Rhizobium sp. Root482]KQY18570.1 nucleotidyltransferase [Rhizobium sp. Root482]
MKTSLEHLPPVKQHELTRVVEIILEEFEDALKGASSEFKKRGRILKIILFGSYARGTFVDEPHTNKGYRSDFDILVVVNNRKFADFSTYWQKAAERLMRCSQIGAPVGLIVHSLREVNAELKRGRAFFVDIRRDGLALYELDNDPLAEPGQVSVEEARRLASGYLSDRLPHAKVFLKTALFCLDQGDKKEAAFLLHQAIEQAYSTVLLVLTNYSPPSHNTRFLRGLAEAESGKLIDVWPRNNQRQISWFNILNEAYVKARYSPHFEISEEALRWLSDQTETLIKRVEEICAEYLNTFVAP